MFFWGRVTNVKALILLMFSGKIKAVYLLYDAPVGLKPLPLWGLGELRNGWQRWGASWSGTA